MFALDRLSSSRFKRNRAASLLGALVIIPAVTALVILGQPATEHAADEKFEPPAGESTRLGTARRASPDEVRAYFNDMFDRLDRDRSGYVELAEAPRRQVISARLGDGTMRQLLLAQAEWFALGDGDQDGKVNRTEYFARLLPPVQAILGVPASWRPMDGERLNRADQRK